MSVEQSTFVVADKTKCTGCKACELACFAGHRKNKTKTVGTVTSPVVPRLYLTASGDACMPIQCHHCEDAPCVKSCLTKALERIDGVVVINKRRCIGCRNCSIACPFGAIEIIADAESTVYKCDLCLGEKEQACVSACPNKALRLVEPNDEILAKRKNALNAFSEEGVR